VTLNDAFRQTIEAGCEALEGTLEGKATPAQTSIAEIASIAEILDETPTVYDDMLAFLGEEDGEEILTLQRNGAAQHARVSPGPVILEAEPQREADPEQSASPAPVPQPESPESTVQKAPALSAAIVKIAEARTQYDKLSERAFAQLLYDRGIYRHRAKDGSDMRIPHTTLRKWLKQAEEAGLL
jgi:hypothetical protein